MAELDYAFLADYARIEPGGKLTAIGASWTRVHAAQFPAGHMLVAAGRVRAKVGAPPTILRMSTSAPNKEYTFAIDAELVPDPHAEPYGDDLVGIVFALNVMIPLPVEGLYRVEISLDGELARTLMFSALHAEGTPADGA